MCTVFKFQPCPQKSTLRDGSKSLRLRMNSEVLCKVCFSRCVHGRWCVSMIWIDSGCYFHLQDHSFMQLLFSSATNSPRSPALPFCMVKLHYQDNFYYPTTLTVLPLGSPLSTLLRRVLRWLARLPLVSSIFSFILQTVFLNSSKVLYSLKRMDRSILRPPTCTLNCWASPLNPTWGGLLLFPLDLSSSASLPPFLSHNPFLCHPGCPHSDLLCSGRLILLDQYLSSVFSPPLSGLLPCPCPSALFWPFLVCVCPLLSFIGENVPISGWAQDASLPAAVSLWDNKIKVKR